jgi:hypothetical protein
MPIADARALPDGSTVLVEGVALTAGDFADGGGYLADASGGIAVLLSDGSFQRGDLLRVSGEVDNRFSQRTLRATFSDVAVLGAGSDPEAQAMATGAIDEAEEAELVSIDGTIVSALSVLTSGVALDVDDGSGPVRVQVAASSGIVTDAWSRGSRLALRGVVGQRDSSGTGLSGYRVQPRDPLDVLTLTGPSPSPSASPTPGGGSDVLTVAAARAMPFNSRLATSGVVTLPADLVEDGTAAIQDATGCIALRLGADARSLSQGQLVEVHGTRATKSGMETLRVTEAPAHLGSRSGPDARRRDTGAAGEADEACLVVVRGAVTLTPRRTSAGNVYFDLDDGSGPLRVFVAPGTGIQTDGLLSGTEVEVVGVLGQETSGSLPLRGYRLWPRVADDLRIVAQPAGVSPPGGSGPTAHGPGGGAASGGGMPGGGATHAPSVRVAQQEQPILSAARGVTHAPIATQPAATAVTQDGRSATDQPPLAAGLLLLAAVTLLGAGVAIGSPDLPARLLAAIRGRFAASDDADVAARPTLEEDESGANGPPAPMPQLVPLQVLEPVPTAGGRSVRASRREHERILPPT